MTFPNSRRSRDPPSLSNFKELTKKESLFQYEDFIIDIVRECQFLVTLLRETTPIKPKFSKVIDIVQMDMKL